MDHESKGLDDLTLKVNYVRDWLNKAEDAIRRGDRMDAVAKLALVKADATNLISSLVPAPRMEKRRRPAHFNSISVRKFAFLVAPFAFIGLFLLGMVVGSRGVTSDITPAINTAPANTVARVVERVTPDGELVALSPLNRAVIEDATENINTTTAPAPRPKVRTTPVTYEEAVVTPPASIPEPVDAVPAVEEPIAVAEKNIDIFDFSMDVIRSARENLDR